MDRQHHPQYGMQGSSPQARSNGYGLTNHSEWSTGQGYNIHQRKRQQEGSSADHWGMPEDYPVSGPVPDARWDKRQKVGSQMQPVSSQQRQDSRYDPSTSVGGSEPVDAYAMGPQKTSHYENRNYGHGGQPAYYGGASYRYERSGPPPGSDTCGGLTSHPQGYYEDRKWFDERGGARGGYGYSSDVAARCREGRPFQEDVGRGPAAMRSSSAMSGQSRAYDGRAPMYGSNRGYSSQYEARGTGSRTDSYGSSGRGGYFNRPGSYQGPASPYDAQRRSGSYSPRYTGGGTSDYAGPQVAYGGSGYGSRSSGGSRGYYLGDGRNRMDDPRAYYRSRGPPPYDYYGERGIPGDRGMPYQSSGGGRSSSGGAYHSPPGGDRYYGGRSSHGYGGYVPQRRSSASGGFGDYPDHYGGFQRGVGPYYRGGYRRGDGRRNVPYDGPRDGFHHAPGYYPRMGRGGRRQYGDGRMHDGQTMPVNPQTALKSFSVGTLGGFSQDEHGAIVLDTSAKRYFQPPVNIRSIKLSTNFYPFPKHDFFYPIMHISEALKNVQKQMSDTRGAEAGSSPGMEESVYEDADKVSETGANAVKSQGSPTAELKLHHFDVVSYRTNLQKICIAPSHPMNNWRVGVVKCRIPIPVDPEPAPSGRTSETPAEKEGETVDTDGSILENQSSKVEPASAADGGGEQSEEASTTGRVPDETAEHAPSKKNETNGEVLTKKEPQKTMKSILFLNVIKYEPDEIGRNEPKPMYTGAAFEHVCTGGDIEEFQHPVSEAARAKVELPQYEKQYIHLVDQHIEGLKRGEDKTYRILCAADIDCFDEDEKPIELKCLPYQQNNRRDLPSTKSYGDQREIQQKASSSRGVEETKSDSVNEEAMGGEGPVVDENLEQCVDSNQEIGSEETVEAQPPPALLEPDEESAAAAAAAGEAAAVDEHEEMNEPECPEQQPEDSALPRSPAVPCGETESDDMSMPSYHERPQATKQQREYCRLFCDARLIGAEKAFVGHRSGHDNQLVKTEMLLVESLPNFKSTQPNVNLWSEEQCFGFLHEVVQWLLNNAPPNRPCMLERTQQQQWSDSYGGYDNQKRRDRGRLILKHDHSERGKIFFTDVCKVLEAHNYQSPEEIAHARQSDRRRTQQQHDGETEPQRAREESCCDIDRPVEDIQEAPPTEEMPPEDMPSAEDAVEDDQQGLSGEHMGEDVDEDEPVVEEESIRPQQEEESSQGSLQTLAAADVEEEVNYQG